MQLLWNESYYSKANEEKVDEKKEKEKPCISFVEECWCDDLWG